MAPLGPQKAPGSPMGVPVGHTDSFIPVDLHMDLPNHFKCHFWELFFDIFWSFLEIFVKKIQNPKKSQKSKKYQLFYENQSCSPRNSMHFALVKKIWGPFFDHFVAIQIFTILGVRVRIGSGSTLQANY